MSARPWYIYALKDPRTDAIRYVGYTVNLSHRMRGHLYDCTREETYKARWIRGLIARNLQPIVEVLETGTGDWEAAERAWIEKLRAGGHRLTNILGGGGGRTGIPQTAEARAKTSAALMGHPVSAEARAKMSAAKKGGRLSKEHKSKISKSLTVAPLNQARLDHLAALRELNRGAKRSDESRAKMSAAALKHYRGKA